MASLKRFWFEFDFIDNINNKNLPGGCVMGCGVTAFNYDDALDILKEKVFKKNPPATIKKVIEDIDISTLEKGHVFPNLSPKSPPNIRGVWFPQGFE
jgi:hypothetical protein